MGYYLNPGDGSQVAKIKWLQENGRAASPTEVNALPELPAAPGEHYVCVVDNGAFIACGIAFDQGELNAFTVADKRVRLFVIVPDEKLVEACPQVKDALATYTWER